MVHKEIQNVLNPGLATETWQKDISENMVY